MTPPETAPTVGIQDAARHLAEGRVAEAAALLERLVRDFPAYVTAHVLLAKAREAAGQPDRALDAWHTAYFLMPGSPLIVRERARLLRAEPARPPATPSLEPEPESEPEEPRSDEVEPQDGAPDPQPEASRPESADAVGTDPDAWVTEEEPATTSGLREDDAELRDEDDWTILEETEAPRVDAADTAEPAVAPPLGHPERSAPHRSAHPEPTEESDDLDTLIEQLERAPRIRPDPEFRDDDAEPDAFGAGEVVSETLARIYETQKQYADAARAYEQLAAQRPGRAGELRAKAEEMRRRAVETGQR